MSAPAEEASKAQTISPSGETSNDPKKPLSPEAITNSRVCTQLPSNPNVPLPTCNRTKSDSEPGKGRLALPHATLWQNGTTLSVALLGGSQHVRNKVQQYALTWNNHSNVRFVFVDGGAANIRVSFNPGGSWSYVGSQNNNVPSHMPTMNFGWFNDWTDDAEFSRTTIHEFGHALGCVHEHQSPTTNIQWNVPAVYQYYWETQGWDQNQVNVNIFQHYSADSTAASYFDPYSIMLYPIPSFLTLDGFFSGMNTVLSGTDIDFIRRVYPM